MIFRRTLPAAVLFGLLTIAALGILSAPPPVQAQRPAAPLSDEDRIALERAALVALYEATDGPNWTHNVNWLSDGHVGHWHGVSVNNLGHVISLDLGRNRLDGQIPDEIGDLSGLIYLSLWGNKLSGQVPPSLSQLSELRQLFLYDNLLGGEFPSEIAEIPSLERLFAGGNRFTGCAPEGGDTLDNDLSTFGLPICGDDASSKPPFTIKAFSISPTQMSLTWSPTPRGISISEIHRYGALNLILTGKRRSYTEGGLDPNTRYEYALRFWLSNSSEGDIQVVGTTLGKPFDLSDSPTPYVSVDAPKRGSTNLTYVSKNEPEGDLIATDFDLAETPDIPPYFLSGPIEVTRRGFKLAIIVPPDSQNGTYRATVSDDWGDVTSSTWDKSRCITFDDLELGSYTFRGSARNSDGEETRIPTKTRLNDGTIYTREAYLQYRTGNTNPWSIERINDAAAIYNLTENARNWMLSDIQVEGMRNEPGYAGYIGGFGVGIGYTVGTGVLMHELMHGFWENWDGYSVPCDAMNLYTFRRDVARFMLEFQKYEHSLEPNPFNEWRPFYNYLVGISYGPSTSYAIEQIRRQTFWQLLQDGNYDALWGPLYHTADTEIPSTAAGKLSLIPPPLRPYFEGFISDSEDTTTWHDELLWYINLPYKERRLWDTAYNYHSVIAHSRKYQVAPDGRVSTIPSETRELLRNADRQVLVDFINTLEDISCNLQEPCQELWNSDFDFWSGYVWDNLHRSALYLEELSPSVGIELERSNWEDVKSVMGELTLYLYCRPYFSVAREYVRSFEGLSDLQRAALLQIVEVFERRDDDNWSSPRCESQATP